jgi:hypothetical protein
MVAVHALPGCTQRTPQPPVALSPEDVGVDVGTRQDHKELSLRVFSAFEIAAVDGKTHCWSCRPLEA